MSQHPIITYHYSKFEDLILLSELNLNILVYPNYYDTLGLVFLGNNYKEASACESQVLNVLDLVNVRNLLRSVKAETVL